VPGAALVALALGALAWVTLAAREVRVRRAPGPATAVEGELYPLRVSIERGRLPLPGGELRDPALDEPLRLGPNPPREISGEVRLGRRGRRELATSSVLIRDPLQLSSREVRATGKAEVLVLPRTEPILRPGQVSQPGGAGGGSGESFSLGDAENGERGLGLRSARSVASELDGVRPHEDGVPASRIHWRTVARTGELFDRRLVPGSQSSHAVVLDARPGADDEEALDAAVRAAGSLCLHLAPAGGCALHLPGASWPLPVDARLGGWPNAHARLALVEAGDGPPPAAGRGNRGLTILVAPLTEPPDARELARIARGSSHLVAPIELPSLSPAFTVAGCNGYSMAAAARPTRTREAEAA
jgi:uncharacterized protein (DUF58 family)